MTEFTPFASTLGGILIGTASLLLLAFHGRIAGVSGIVGGLAGAATCDRRWRIAFMIGLVTGGAILSFALPSVYPKTIPELSPLLLLAGVLVGYGTRLGNGCTSGHGVCGISRFSPRSLLATMTFMTTGAIAVYVLRHILGAASS